eukprot:GILJ01009606.1.p1 GENE.GILJ01009606.1~~GILJ01009606.1.p1  ORF type:complete len:1212 (-),score=155.35 GILJ01009606.1:177-3335(-)
MEVGLCLTDNSIHDDSRVIYVNRGLEKLTGADPQEVYGKHHPLIVGPKTEFTPMINLKKGSAGGTPYTTWLLTYHKDGRPIPGIVTTSPLHLPFKVTSTTIPPDPLSGHPSPAEPIRVCAQPLRLCEVCSNGQLAVSTVVEKTDGFEGFLFKLGAFFVAWHQRWCVLTPQALFYFAENPDSQTVFTCNGSIPLRGAIVQDLHQTSLIGSYHQFNIVTPSRTYQLGSPTAAVKDQWIAAISHYIKLLRDPCPDYETYKRHNIPSRQVPYRAMSTSFSLSHVPIRLSKMVSSVTSLALKGISGLNESSVDSDRTVDLRSWTMPHVCQLLDTSPNPMLLCYRVTDAAESKEPSEVPTLRRSKTLGSNNNRPSVITAQRSTSDKGQDESTTPSDQLRIVYCNRTMRKLLQINEEISVTGQRLMQVIESFSSRAELVNTENHELFSYDSLTSPHIDTTFDETLQNTLEAILLDDTTCVDPRDLLAKVRQSGDEKPKYGNVHVSGVYQKQQSAASFLSGLNLFTRQPSKNESMDREDRGSQSLWGCVLSVVDLTRFKSRLEKEDLLLRSLDCLNPTGVLLLGGPDSQLECIYANPAFLNVSGFSMGEIRGLTRLAFMGREAILDDRALESLRNLTQDLMDGAKVHADVYMSNKDGVCFWSYCCSHPIMNETGNIIYYLLFCFPLRLPPSTAVSETLQVIPGRWIYRSALAYTEAVISVTKRFEWLMFTPHTIFCFDGSSLSEPAVSCISLRQPVKNKKVKSGVRHDQGSDPNALHIHLKDGMLLSLTMNNNAEKECVNQLVRYFMTMNRSFEQIYMIRSRENGSHDIFQLLPFSDHVMADDFRTWGDPLEPEWIAQSEIFHRIKYPPERTNRRILELMHELPIVLRSEPMELLYSSFKHGFGIRSMLHQTLPHKGASILFILDLQGRVFGAFLGQPWMKSRHFYGSPQTFLFSLWPHLHIYRSTGANENFVISNPNMLGFGGDSSLTQFGLYLSGELEFQQGSSTSCDTFGNLGSIATTGPSEESFCVVCAEVWGFSDSLATNALRFSETADGSRLHA